MKYNMTFHFLLLLVVVVVLTMGMQLPAFSGGLANEEENSIKENELIICPEPRPEICTMDYRPVCAQRDDGTFRTYSNGCTSCTDPSVIGYRNGACE